MRKALCAPLIQEAARFEAKYSRYLPSSLVSQINQSAGATHRFDAEAAAIIDYAAQLFVQSDGLFDITSGLLRKAWGFFHAQLPDAQAVQALLPSIGWQCGMANPILRLPPTMQIDLGA